MARRRKRVSSEYNIQIAFALVIIIGVLSLVLLLGLDNVMRVMNLAAAITGIGIALWLYPRLPKLIRFSKNSLDPAKQFTLNEIDAMSGVEFEKCVGDMFARQGYHVEYTRASTDFGVDIILTKDRIRTAVQTKRYSKPLTQAPVREVVAGMMHYKCSKAIVVTNSTFTASAHELAKSNYCKLIDREKIAQILTANN